jgi:hypothetical protein
MAIGTALRSEYNVKAVSLHDWHALVTKSIVKVNLIPGMNLVNTRLIYRSLGVGCGSDAEPK